MVAINPQYIIDTAGNRMVILTESEFNSLVEELEDAEDIRLYDEAKKQEQVSIDAETAFALIEEKRKHL
jgi:hypothetical protein